MGNDKRPEDAAADPHGYIIAPPSSRQSDRKERNGVKVCIRNRDAEGR